MKKLLGLVVAMMMTTVAEAADIHDVRSFTYWLSSPDPALIAASGFDLVVVDHSRDGTLDGRFRTDEVALMQRKPDGRRRLVVSYMSIGEAEDYRGYWQSSWSKTPPKWLADENPDWAGNFKVRYWHPDWQKLIFGHPEAYLDQIIDAGFDGVYLDIVDAYWYFEEQGRTTAAAEMIGFITAIAVYARERSPGFLIIPQNAEDLLAYEEYLGVIDAQAKEDLYFGHEGSDTANAPDVVAWPMKHLKLALKAGLPVLLVEYPEQRKTVEQVYKRGRADGLIPYATVRDLDQLVVNSDLDPALPGLDIRE